MKPFVFIISLLLGTTVLAQTGLSPVQIAERNKPGTVMIQCTYKGTVSAYEPETNEEAARELALQIKQQLTDEGRFSEDLFWNTYILTYCRNVDKYMYRGTNKVSKELNTTMMGSGFIITPDGYVVTNAHVVDENDEQTRQNFVQQAFQEILDQDAAEVEKTMGRKLTEEESKALVDANSWYFQQTLQVDDVSKEFTVVMGISDDKGKIVPMVIPATLVTQGQPIPGKDVAILRLTQKHTYPTIRVGDDNDMRVGDQVYVLGYPAVATFHPLISEESVSEATLTRGLVSARKNMKGGWEVLQTDASITHGNSGGPVMNDKGEVIGLATFGSMDEQRGQEVQGMNFIVPTTIVKEYIEKARIKPEMSEISLAYEEAMSQFDKSHFKKALEKFKQVQSMNPSFPFVEKYIADAQRNIDKGLDKSEGGMMIYYYIGGAVLLLALFLYLLLRKK